MDQNARKSVFLQRGSQGQPRPCWVGGNPPANLTWEIGPLCSNYAGAMVVYKELPILKGIT